MGAPCALGGSGRGEVVLVQQLAAPLRTTTGPHPPRPTLSPAALSHPQSQASFFTSQSVSKGDAECGLPPGCVPMSCMDSGEVTSQGHNL